MPVGLCMLLMSMWSVLVPVGGMGRKAGENGSAGHLQCGRAVSCETHKPGGSQPVCLLTGLLACLHPLPQKQHQYLH